MEPPKRNPRGMPFATKTGLPNSVFYRLECTDIFTHSRRLRLRYRRSIPFQVYDFDIPADRGYSTSNTGTGTVHASQGPKTSWPTPFPTCSLFSWGGEELHLLDEFDIPKDKYKIIGNNHNSTVGHFGVDKTLSKITEINPKTGLPRAEPWPHMREHVKRFIKRCPICQKLSIAKVQVQTELFSIATYEQMERLSVDTIVPLD